MSLTGIRNRQAASHPMRTFYTLILTQMLSLLGSNISSLATGIWVYNQTGNATPLALVSFFAVIPKVLASGVAGVLADRWDRRYVMALADAGQAIGTLLLLAGFVTDAFQLWHLYLVTFIKAIFGVFQQPAFQASVTMLIPDAQRDRANAIQQLTDPLAGMIAPAIAGFTFSLIGVEGAIIIDLVTFLLAVGVVLNVHIPYPQQTEEGRKSQGSIWGEALGGLRFLWARRPLFILTMFTTVVNFLVVGVMALLTPYILARTGSEAELGVIMSVFNLGAIMGAIIIGAWGGTRPRIHTMMPALIVVGVALMLLGTAQSAVMLGAVAFLLMVPLPIMTTPYMSMMQAKVPPDLQGRVFAANGQLSMLLTPIAYLVVGPLADDVFEPAVHLGGWRTITPLVGSRAGAGIGLMLLLAGGITTVLTLIIYTLPVIRHMEARLPDYVPVEQSEETGANPGPTFHTQQSRIQAQGEIAASEPAPTG